MQENIKIKNSKDQNLAAVINRSEKKTNKLAILCPGFLDSKDYLGLKGLADMLSQKGFTVVRFNPTGTWDSEGDISEFTTSQYLKDIKSVKDFMLQEGEYKYILLSGHSMGGRMSMLFAEEDSQVSILVVIMSGNKFSGENRWGIDGIRIDMRDLPNNPSEKIQYSVPLSFVKDAQKYDTLKKIKNLHTPILFVAGEKDHLCPPSKMQPMFDEANESKKFVIVPDIGHDYRHFPEQVEKVNKVIMDYIKELNA